MTTTLPMEPRGAIPSTMAATEAAPILAAGAIAKPISVLQGDEVVQLLLKPALWYVVALSWRWVVGAVLVFACSYVSGRGQWTLTHNLIVQASLFVAAARCGYAMMQWSSRAYVLTNRRVMRVTGVLRADMRSCLLTRVSEISVRQPLYQRWLRLGSVQIRCAEAKAPPVHWNFIKDPHKVHELLERAVRRSQHGDCG